MASGWWDASRVSHASGLLRLICTGTGVTLASQAIIDAGFTHPSVQMVAVVRYASVTCYTGWARRASCSPTQHLSRRGRLLLLFNGCLDCFAYGLNCVGFKLCGAALALTIFAATSQTLTALLSFLLTRQRLSNMRLLAVLIVNVGLLLRAAPHSSLGDAARTRVGTSLTSDQLLGSVFIFLASFCYSLLGASYEFFLSVEKPAPPYADYMHLTSRIGLAAALLYQVIVVVPDWSHMVAAPLAASGCSAWGLGAILVGFGAMYNLHNYCTAEVFKREGAVAVNLANACRSSTVSLLAGGILCSPEKPWHCANGRTLASAGVVTAGAALWALNPSRSAAGSAGDNAAQVKRSGMHVMTSTPPDGCINPSRSAAGSAGDNAAQVKWSGIYVMTSTPPDGCINPSRSAAGLAGDNAVQIQGSGMQALNPSRSAVGSAGDNAVQATKRGMQVLNPCGSTRASAGEHLLQPSDGNIQVPLNPWPCAGTLAGDNAVQVSRGRMQALISSLAAVCSTGDNASGVRKKRVQALKPSQSADPSAGNNAIEVEKMRMQALSPSQGVNALAGDNAGEVHKERMQALNPSASAGVSADVQAVQVTEIERRAHIPAAGKKGVLTHELKLWAFAGLWAFSPSQANQSAAGENSNAFDKKDQ